MEGTEDRILTAFLQLAARNGLDGVTTRELAREAGVNPATLFRRFGDKTTIAVEAIRRFSFAPELAQRDPAVRPEHAAEDLLNALLYLIDINGRQPVWLRLGVAQIRQIAEVRAELRAIPEAMYGYMRRALAQAGPALRPEVDHHVTALQLMGMLVVTRRLVEYGSLEMPQREEFRKMIQAAIRPLLRNPNEDTQGT